MAGFPLISTCQSPVMRLTLKLGSLGSLNVARPSRVEVEPDPGVKDGVVVPRSRSPGAVGSLASRHAGREMTSASTPARLRRSSDIEASREEWKVPARLSAEPLAPYIGGQGQIRAF